MYITERLAIHGRSAVLNGRSLNNANERNREQQEVGTWNSALYPSDF